jgi:hypothetical protein
MEFFLTYKSSGENLISKMSFYYGTWGWNRSLCKFIILFSITAEEIEGNYWSISGNRHYRSFNIPNKLILILLKLSVWEFENIPIGIMWQIIRFLSKTFSIWDWQIGIFTNLFHCFQNIFLINISSRHISHWILSIPFSHLWYASYGMS